MVYVVEVRRLPLPYLVLRTGVVRVPPFASHRTHAHDNDNDDDFSTTHDAPCTQHSRLPDATASRGRVHPGPRPTRAYRMTRTPSQSHSSLLPPMAKSGASTRPQPSTLIRASFPAPGYQTKAASIATHQQAGHMHAGCSMAHACKTHAYARACTQTPSHSWRTLRQASCRAWRRPSIELCASQDGVCDMCRWTNEGL